MQGERDMLKTDLEQLQASLREAQLAYLPIWSHSYYAAVRQAAEPALKYHREVRSVLLGALAVSSSIATAELTRICFIPSVYQVIHAVLGAWVESTHDQLQLYMTGQRFTCKSAQAVLLHILPAHLLCSMQEIVTGRAYTKARGAAQDAYKTAHAAAHPHLQKVWVVIEPTFSKVYEQIKIYWEKLQTELSKEPYSTYVAKAQGALQALYNHALGLRARAIDLWNSEEVRTVNILMSCAY